MKKSILAIALSLAMALPLIGQSSSNPPQNPQSPNDTTAAPDSTPQSTSPATTQIPEDQNIPAQNPQFNYRVNVVQRSTQAVDYRDRGGTTQVDFKGASLMPKVDGRARVTGHTGRLAIDTS